MPLHLLPNDLNIAGQTQGDILYFNGTNWVCLAAGTSGHFLRTQGAAANPQWNSSGGSGSIRQTIIKEILVDTTTTSSTFVTLLSQAITTVSGTLLRVTFACGTSNSKAAVTYAFRASVDAVAQRGCGASPGSGGATQASVIELLLSGLSAAAHTILIEWKSDTGASNTSQCRPVTLPNTEFASLVLQEITP